MDAVTRNLRPEEALRKQRRRQLAAYGFHDKELRPVQINSKRAEILDTASQDHAAPILSNNRIQRSRKLEKFQKICEALERGILEKSWIRDAREGIL